MINLKHLNRVTLNYLKRNYHKLKNHPHLDPQKEMTRINNYMKRSIKKYYGSDLMDALYSNHTNPYEKKTDITYIMNRQMEHLVMKPSEIRAVNNIIPATDKFFVDVIHHTKEFDHRQPQSFHRLKISDIILAIKRVIKQLKKLNAKEQYDPSDKSEVDRDVDSKTGQVRLTAKDLSIIGYSSAQYANQLPLGDRKGTVLGNIVEGIVSLHLNISNLDQIDAIIDAMKKEKNNLFKQMAVADQKDWYRLLNKLLYTRKLFMK